MGCNASKTTAVKDKKVDHYGYDHNSFKVNRAAGLIQAYYRGYRYRKIIEDEEQQEKEALRKQRLREKGENDSALEDSEDENVRVARIETVKPNKRRRKQQDDDVDIDLSDPEVNQAALKIQKGFRRKQNQSNAL